MIKGLYETHLYVENLEISIEFYTKVLGLKICRFDTERRTAFLWIGEDKQAMLGLWEKTKAEIDLRHFAFECDTLARVYNACLTLLAHLCFYSDRFVTRTLAY